MVPGQVITRTTIGSCAKLDVKEIHGYDAKGAEARASRALANR